MRQVGLLARVAVLLWLVWFGTTGLMAEADTSFSVAEGDAPFVVAEEASDYFSGSKNGLYRWSNQTRFVMVYIQKAEQLPGWRPENEALVQSAFREWQHALDNRFVFVFTNDRAQSDVTVSWWTQPPPGVSPDASGSQNVAFWDKYMSRNDISLGLISRHQGVWPPEKLYAFALHEIGHMLGIQDHSNNPDDIMAPVTRWQTHLSPRDIATIRKIYAAKPTYTNPPGYHLAQFEQFKRSALLSSSARPVTFWSPWSPF